MMMKVLFVFILVVLYLVEVQASRRSSFRQGEISADPSFDSRMGGSVSRRSLPGQPIRRLRVAIQNNRERIRKSFGFHSSSESAQELGREESLQLHSAFDTVFSS